MAEETREREPEQANPAGMAPSDIARGAVHAARGAYDVWHDIYYPESRLGHLFGGPEPVFPDDYARVARVQAGSLAEAAALTTHGGNLFDGTSKAWQQNPGTQALVLAPRSTDLGDVIVDPAGTAYRVERQGFRRIEAAAVRPFSPAEIAPAGQSQGELQEIGPPNLPSPRKIASATAPALPPQDQGSVHGQEMGREI